jgi:hypothetical protein
MATALKPKLPDPITLRSCEVSFHTPVRDQSVCVGPSLAFVSFKPSIGGLFSWLWVASGSRSGSFRALGFND